jgi:N-acetylneuraminate synthase
MIIDGRKIGSNEAPYIIAEMSNNHLNDLKKAFRLLVIAKNSGVDAIKIQTYNADSLTIECSKPNFIIPDPLWKGKTYYDLYKEITMPFSWNKKLFDKANEIGITIFSSPFDSKSVDLLEDLNCPAYKIASFEAKDHEFIKKVASTKKPLVISTGVSNFLEIEETLEIARESGSMEIAILHCISSYPSNTQDMNILAIKQLMKLGVEVGLSDHSLGNLAPIMAVAFGATIIEKHFTESRSDGGPDAAFSLEPNELKSLKTETTNAWIAKSGNGVLNDNRLGKHHQRSLYFVLDIKKGEKITSKNVRSIRPGFGLEPRFFNEILGKKLIKDVERGDAVTWESFK